MNKASTKIIKSIFLSAALSLIHANAKGNSIDTEYDNRRDENDKNVNRLSKQRVFRNIIKLGKTGAIFKVNAHTSHNSHSSHSSHSSHYSGSTHQTSINPIGNSIKASYSPQDSSKMIDFSSISLGCRVLELGRYGKDVDELVVFLKTNSFLSKEYNTQKKGFFLYSKEVEDAVRCFQKEAKLNRVDGRFGQEEKNAYDNWGKS